MMNKFIKPMKVILCLLLMVVAEASYAVPFLQLGIIDGVYDPVDQTIVTSNDNFTVVAYSQSQEEDPYFLSIALTPSVAEFPVPNFGSFSFDGNDYDVSDMIYGVPPIEADHTAEHDAGDLGQHGIFETYFMEHEFSFGGLQTVSINTQDDPGFDPTGSPGTDLYYKTFEFDVSNLLPGFELHFDLFDVKVKNNGDYDKDNFAPFSHDAATVGSVPEPGMFTLLLIGIAGLFGKKRFSVKKA